MKNVIMAILAFGLLTAPSCKKSSTTTSAGGSWTFKTISYSAVFCTGNLYGNAGTLSAGDVSLTGTGSSTADDLVCTFYNALPTSAGNYTVIGPNGNPVAGQIQIVTTIGGVNGKTYVSTGGNGAETIAVTVSGGKVTLIGSGIEMYTPSNPSDSSALSLNITQLQ